MTDDAYDELLAQVRAARTYEAAVLLLVAAGIDPDAAEVVADHERDPAGADDVQVVG